MGKTDMTVMVVNSNWENNTKTLSFFHGKCATSSRSKQLCIAYDLLKQCPSEPVCCRFCCFSTSRTFHVSQPTVQHWPNVLT